MKKMVWLICLVMLLSGCVKIEDNESDYKNLISYFLSDDVVTNRVSLGYKFYLPRGVKLLRNYDDNQTFLIDDNFVYMYVDIISYYYGTNVSYEKKYDGYYYEEFSYNDKTGMIEITRDGDEVYVVIIYNYAKIEFYSLEDDLVKMISLSMILLNNIDFNDMVIENMLENSSGNYSTVVYELDKPDDASSNFSQYLEDYIQEDEEDDDEALPGE